MIINMNYYTTENKILCKRIRLEGQYQFPDLTMVEQSICTSFHFFFAGRLLKKWSHIEDSHCRALKAGKICKHSEELQFPEGGRR